MTNKTRPLRVDDETLKDLKKMSRKLSVLEERDVSMGKIVKRILKGDDIFERLRLGSLDRRRKK